jgi:DNA-binding phage protein
MAAAKGKQTETAVKKPRRDTAAAREAAAAAAAAARAEATSKGKAETLARLREDAEKIAAHAKAHGVEAITLGDRLQKMLETRNLSLARAAAMSGMTRQQLWRILEGKSPSNPGILTIQTLVRSLGFRMKDLFSDGVFPGAPVRPGVQVAPGEGDPVFAGLLGRRDVAVGLLEQCGESWAHLWSLKYSRTYETIPSASRNEPGIFPSYEQLKSPMPFRSRASWKKSPDPSSLVL